MSLLLALTVATSGAHTLDAESGAFVFTGVDATILKGHVLDAEAGSFTITGQDAIIVKGHTINCEAGSFVFAGNSAEFVYSGDSLAAINNYPVHARRIGRR